MKPFSRILVGLDLTEMDFILLRFMHHFMRIYPHIKDLYFIHVEKDLEQASIKEEGTLKGNIPIDEQFKMRMREEVEKYYRNDLSLNVRYKIVEGDPLKQLLHWSRIKHIDLIVAGKKVQQKGRGIVMQKLARKSDCSILFVPENYKPRFRKILIPVDFTKRTDNVFETACMIRNQLPHSKFICQHVVEVPSGYTRIGKTYEEFAEIMTGHARNKWKKYIEEHDIKCLDVQPEFISIENGSVAKSIIDFAHAQNIDMIMMGSKRQTNVSAFILGSVGEDLVNRDKDILLLLVKHQNKPYDFFKAMQKV